MKNKLMTIALLLLGAVMLCGAGESYNIALLGDVHYDHNKFHDLSKMKHLGIPQGKNVLNKDGYYSWRNHSLWVEMNKGGSIEKNTPLNMQMWEKYTPVLLKKASDKAKEAKVKYTFQLGDLIHGDCYDLNLHKENLQQALQQLTSRFDKVLTITGNHDTRGTDGQKAWNEVINPHLDKTIPNLKRKNSNYYTVIGGDLYMFYDVMNFDVAFFEQAIKENPSSRYTFFVAHVPLLPTGKRAVRNILSDDIKRLFALLEKRNAIVLSGHTHKVSFIEYFNPANNRKMSQFILNSTIRFPQKQTNFKPVKPDMKQDAFADNAGKSKQLWSMFYKDKVTTQLHTDGSGYGILRVSDQGVFVDYRNFDSDKVYTYKLR